MYSILRVPVPCPFCQAGFFTLKSLYNFTKTNQEQNRNTSSMLNFTTNRANTLVFVLAMALTFTSCDETSTGIEDEPLEVQMAEDIPANADAGREAAPDFTFYSLAEGEIVAEEDSASTQWDLAFSGTTILTNSGNSGPGQGGAVILDVPFEQVETAPSEGYAVDTDQSKAIPTGSGNGWYNYTGNNNGQPPQFAVLPIEDRTLIIRTAEGNYAMVEILSYYEGNPDTSTEEFQNSETRSDGRHYTFRYVIQTNGSRNLNAGQ
jgi:hypothetical protein